MLRGAGALGLGLTFRRWLEPEPALALGHRVPGSLPYPRLPEGTDTIPQIEHIVVLMMENHSFDNYFGTLARRVGLPFQNGQMVAANADNQGNLIHAFHMPSACQLNSLPSNSWNASHISLGGGHNNGFVRASGPVAMGYWTDEDIPFYHGLARTFPLASRWFSSTLCQTYPNRRFLMAGTAAGIISTNTAALTAPPPPNGNIFERLDAHGIAWRNYYSDLPSVAILLAYASHHGSNLVPISQFFADAAAGTLPAVSLVDPAFNGGESEENPDDIRVGELFASQVINAVMLGPGWPKTLLVWLYDEHGGYYDHIVPPPAIAPDNIPPNLAAGDQPGGYDRYGFRVPAVIVSPYARRNHISHRTRDHTSILRFIERKWNLGALTFRDANAHDLLDCLHLHEPPAFLEPPTLPAPALAASNPPTCTPGNPGTIPPPDAVTPAASVRAGAVARAEAPETETRIGRPLAEAWGRVTAAPR